MTDDTTGSQHVEAAMDLDTAPVAARFAVSHLGQTPPPGVDENGVPRAMAEDVVERSLEEPGERRPAALAESEPDAAG
jgi:hypothetical protein